MHNTTYLYDNEEHVCVYVCNVCVYVYVYVCVSPILLGNPGVSRNPQARKRRRQPPQSASVINNTGQVV